MPTDNPEYPHWLLVKEMAIALSKNGAKVKVLDINHKKPCGYINNGKTRKIVNTNRLEGTTTELTTQMNSAFRKDARLNDMDIDCSVLIGREHDSLNPEKSILIAVDKFFEYAQSARCIFVIGGIFQPYKLEPFLRLIDSKIFYYAMNYRNESRYKHIYSKCLSTAPSCTKSFWQNGVIKRPNFINEDSISILKSLSLESQEVLSKLNDNDKICISCSKNIVSILNLDFLENIVHFLQVSPNHKLLAIGGSRTTILRHVNETLDTDKIRLFEKQLYAITFEENLSDLYSALHLFQSCFLNPIHPGNGRCILLAALRGIPTLVAGINDCQFVSDKIEKVDLSNHKTAIELLNRTLNSEEFKLDVKHANSLAISENKLYSSLFYQMIWGLS